MKDSKQARLLLDVKELAELTGFAEGTLYHFISQKRIPVIRFSSRCVRFRRKDIEEWLDELYEAPRRFK